ncbi:adenylate/guanylate cyclase domain-containing protein [Legionella sp. PC1000]|uniref:hypothetical protein n=1 Tax=Legionella sp. PC1000 TaxID=2746060 RepID=UPI0018625458|nr:hypothetical protein [Legionella sp. PC1000]QLZ70025.1 adenylate/guanylate cyclase domain-containing protein [Legionella sp. PC1000]
MAQTPLEEEILKTEKLRTTILSIIFILMALIWTIFFILSPEVYYRHAKVPAITMPSSLAAIALYFLLMRKIICRCALHKKNIPIFLRYLNAFIEINIPTLGIIVIMNLQTPIYSLLMPPVLLYFIFIILSSLTLNEWICRFSGLVAAIEYWGLSYYVLNYTDTSNIDSYLVEWYAFAARGGILLVGGSLPDLSLLKLKNSCLQLSTRNKNETKLRAFLAGMYRLRLYPSYFQKMLKRVNTYPCALCFWT